MTIIELTNAVDINQMGGKAANLARAFQSGLQIPNGFVLPRSALGLFLETNRFLPTVQTTLDAYQDLEWRDRMDRFEILRVAALKLAIPKAVQEEVETFFLNLLSRSLAGVAVRSSGVCEDLEKASFAGIYESFLGVTDLDTFWQSVVRCWCSAWSPQTAAYAQKMGMTLPVDGMAVLVQTMIPAESSGVIFTADPVTGNPWRFVLNAAFGLGSRLVDGSAPADRFVLAWDTNEILEKRIVRKPNALFFQYQNWCEVALDSDLDGSASVTDDQAQSIGQMALIIDRLFDRRMDIEWAFARGQLYLLQARPLTAIPPFFPYTLSPEEAEETWTPYLNSYGTMNEHERLVAPFHRDRWMKELWDRFLSPDDVFPHRTGKERDFNSYRYTTEWKWANNPPDWPRIEHWLDENEKRLRQGWLTQLERVREVNTGVDEQMTAALNNPATRAVDLVRTTLAYRREENEMQAAVWYAPQWLIFTCEEMLKRFIEDLILDNGIPDLPAGLLQGLSCYSFEHTIDAQALGRGITEQFVVDAFAQQPLSQVIPFLSQNYSNCTFLRDFADYCRTYGLELPSPDGNKNPGLDLDGVLLLIKSSISGQAIDARNVLAEGTLHRQAIEAQVCDWLRQNRPDQLTRFNKLLDWAQFWTPALDNRKWHCTMTIRLGELNHLTRQSLVAEGLIDQPDHFLLLTPQDWAAYAEDPDAEALRSLYQERRHEYERNRRLEPLPFLGRPPAPKVLQPSQTQEREKETLQDLTGAKRVIQGEGIASGKARGLSHKVASLSSPDAMEHLTNENILICGRDEFNVQWRRDWYSLFMIVRGLVTVEGAQLHHATQIARECGVPFINLPGEDIDNLPDGRMIEIDGQAGTLTVL